MVELLWNLLTCAFIWYTAFHVGFLNKACIMMSFHDFEIISEGHEDQWEFTWKGPVHIGKDGSRRRVILSPFGYFHYMIGGYWVGKY